MFHGLSFSAYFLAVGLCSHLLQEETFMMMVGERHLALHLALCSYCCVPSLNCGIWFSHGLSSLRFFDQQGSKRNGFNLIEWAFI